MKSFVTLSLFLGVANAGPLNLLLTSGAPSGPVHPVTGDLVATKQGLQSLSLDGFSEDDDQDGFVDPIAQVVPVVAPVTYAHAHPLIPGGHPIVHTHPIVLSAKENDDKEEKKAEVASVVAYNAPVPVIPQVLPLTYSTTHHVGNVISGVVPGTYAFPLVPAVASEEEKKE